MKQSDSVRQGSVLTVRMTRASEAHGANAIVGHMQIFAEKIDDLKTDVAVLVEELQKFLAADRRELNSIHGFGSNFVTSTAERCAKAQDFPWGNNAQGHATATFGAHGQTNSSLAKRLDAASDLAFAKQDRTTRAILDGFDGIEFVESFGRKIAENTISTLSAVKTAQRHTFLSLTVDTRNEERAQ